MLLLPIHTPIIHPGDDLAKIIAAEAHKQHAPGIHSGDILVISSKVVATAESRIIDLSSITPSAEAQALSAACKKNPQFCEAVLREMRRMHGQSGRICPGAIFTEVKPGGLPEGTILIANAGLDGSNAPQGHAIGWPADPVASARRLRESCTRLLVDSNKQINEQTNKREKAQIAVVLSDSCLHPRRSGVIALALTVSGFDPIRSCIGERDLYGREMKITREALADQLAVAANMLMGNVAESTPAVIVRDHAVPLTDFEGWVPGIAPEEDLFGTLLL